MSLAISIHIGVNQPGTRYPGQPLSFSEATNWRMAELASQAGCQSILVLRGPAATSQAVHEAMTAAAGTLTRGDTLFVSFSGHGSLEPELGMNRDERNGSDQAWCLADEILLDDKLAGYWRLFDEGVRILVVSESCYGGGIGRKHDELDGAAGPVVAANAPPPVLRTPGGGNVRGPGAPVEEAGPCIVKPPAHDDGIRASLLLLAAADDSQPARDGVFGRYLLDEWDGGLFRGSYCDLYRRVRARVIGETCSRGPTITMLGAPDLDFPMQPAFRFAGARSASRSGGG